MLVNLDIFFINQEYLDNLVDSNIITQISIDIYRGVILKNKKSLFSILLTEIFTFILVLILVIPITFILIRNWVNISQNSAAINQVLFVLIGVCLGIMLLINIYLWKQTKKTKSLALLLDKAEQYNHLIQSLKLIEHLESVNSANNQENWLNQNLELIKALQVIKDSLIQAFTVEKIIRKHQRMINNKYDLLNNIENNLTTLITFDTHAFNSHYRELLQNAIQIGITVHKEMRKLL